jgi:hypothetical protein
VSTTKKSGAAGDITIVRPQAAEPVHLSRDVDHKPHRRPSGLSRRAM